MSIESKLEERQITEIGKVVEDFSVDAQTIESDIHPFIDLGPKIDSGSFGVVRKARLANNDQELAIKLEDRDAKNPKLKHEYDIYRVLGLAKGIPMVYHYGKCGERGEHRCLLMQLLGHSLHYYFKQCELRFSVKTTVQIGLQILDRIEFLHSKGVVYRDVKPENFLFGHTDSKTLYIIDFGLSNLYIDLETGEHIAYKENCHSIGTPRFMSRNSHCNREQSRRDDLESLSYLLIYFLRGSLPWQNLPVSGSQKYKEIAKKKQSTLVSELCDGLPTEFETMLNYSRDLQFTETPDYEQLRTLLRTLLTNNGLEADDVYDWDENVSFSSSLVQTTLS